MTKNRKAVLMHSPATGLWFYVGTRACYWVLSASPSNSKKKIPLRSPPPGFVSAFTLAHAVCSWCQISRTSGVTAEAKTPWILENIWRGTAAWGTWGWAGKRGPGTAPPPAPWHPMGNTAVSLIYNKSNQALLHSPRHPSLGEEFGWVKKAGALPSPGDHSAWQGGCWTLSTPTEQHPVASPSGCCTRASGKSWLDLSHPAHQGQ